MRSGTSRFSDPLRIHQTNVGRASLAYEASLTMVFQNGAHIIYLLEPHVFSLQERTFTQQQLAYDTFLPTHDLSQRLRGATYILRRAGPQPSQIPSHNTCDITAVRISSPGLPNMDIWNVYNAFEGSEDAWNVARTLLTFPPTPRFLALGDFNSHNPERVYTSHPDGLYVEQLLTWIETMI